MIAATDTVPELVGLLEGGGRITKQRLVEFQQDYIATHREDLRFRRTLEAGPFLGAKNVGGGVLPDFYLVPAIRDLSDETKIKTTTVFGRLLQRAIAEMTERDPRVAEIRDQISSLVSELNERGEEEEDPSQIAALEASIARELADWNVGVKIKVTPPEIETLFELGTELRIDDGHDSIAESKGHGLQRALIFALIKAWASALRTDSQNDRPRARKASESVVFAFEEPELFLHPHAQRTLAASLRQIASTANHQVFVCSHSTHFVDLDHYRSIVIVSKESTESGTQIRQCVDDLFEGEDAQYKKHRFHMAAWINPDRGELFFARKTILVEGETEKAALPYLAARLGCFDPNVSVIDCGSKNNLPLYIRILNAFGIRYTVVHDEDPLPEVIPDTWSADKARSMRHTFELNEIIRSLVVDGLGNTEVCSPDFEGLAGVPRSQSERKGKALAALEHLQSIDTNHLPPRLVEIVRSAYATGAHAVHATGRT